MDEAWLQVKCRASARGLVRLAASGAKLLRAAFIRQDLGRVDASRDIGEICPPRAAVDHLVRRLQAHLTLRQYRRYVVLGASLKVSNPGGPGVVVLRLVLLRPQPPGGADHLRQIGPEGHLSEKV